MHSLTARRLLLIVSGGIAAYKAPEVVRRLREAGAEVRVVMTPGATRFVAPATADFLARLRAGLADDLASAICLATTAPLLLVPAMNQQMWQHAATVDNLAVLAARGARLCGPASGSQACGETGPGRMVESADIVAAAGALFAAGALAGRRVLVTAGPTREALDPVRYISNHSSGKMGYAVAAAARDAGAAVTLVSGPTRLPAPSGVTRIDVESATDMLAAVLGEVAGCDIFIATAAVADYRPAAASEAKLKRDGAPRALELVPNPDILATVAARADAPFTVGFAAETHDVEAHARDKLARKRIDLIAANEVGGELGFDSEDNALLVLWADGREALPRAPKVVLARQLLELVATRYHASRGGGAA